MRGLTIILILSVLVSSILAMPKAYEDRNEQLNAISAARKYLLRQYENGMISLLKYINVYMFNIALMLIGLCMGIVIPLPQL